MASNIIEVYVKLASGKAVELQHLPNESVRCIAEKIAAAEHVAERRVRLKYQGKTLDKDKTIGFLGICRETILKAEVLSPHRWTLTVQAEGGDACSLAVDDIDTVAQLRDTLFDLTNIAKHEMKVMVGGLTVTKETDILRDTCITDAATISVSRKMKTQTEAAEEPEVDDETREQILSSFRADGRRVDVVFSFDTTGSMYSCLQTVRYNLRNTCTRLLRDIPNIRIGLIAHGDYCDCTGSYVIRCIDLTTDVDVLVDFAENVPATGGGDSPEAYEWVLRRAQQLDWAEDSAKALFVIGDDVPHPPSYTDQHVFWRDELGVLTGMGVKVYGVHANNCQANEPFYRQLALSSDGFYLKLRDFQLITDMFLAVCYREAAEGQLEAFVAEVEQQGRMCDQTKEMLDALDDKTTTTEHKTDNPEPAPTLYVSAGWWDPSLDTACSPQYTYTSETDTWRRASSPRIPVITAIEGVRSLTPTKPKKKGVIRRLLCCGAS